MLGLFIRLTLYVGQIGISLVDGAMLQESGDILLLEDGGNILL